MLQYLASLADNGSEKILAFRPMENSKINRGLLVKWLAFMPFLLFIGLVGGAFDGVFRLFHQAKEDIFEG